MLFESCNNSMKRCYYYLHQGKEEPEAQKGEVPKLIQVAQLRPKPGRMPCHAWAQTVLISRKLRDIVPIEEEGKRIKGT